MQDFKTRAEFETEIEYENYLTELKITNRNEQVGELGYYDCKECLNKGHIFYGELDYRNILQTKIKTCKCITTRKIYTTLEKSGIEKSLFEKSTIGNFKATEEWQVMIKESVEKFIGGEYEKEWFVISGGSGSGKTHLCTAIFQHLIMQGKDAKYMLWKEEITKLKQMKKSSHTDNIAKYENELARLTSVEVLYIDDFLKLMNDYSKNEDLDLAFEILNKRYSKNLTTIISTEFMKSEIFEFDNAVCGRINEKAIWQQIKNETNRNYRMKDNELI
ncbi:MAG: ATP-binding protein [bacterium]